MLSRITLSALTLIAALPTMAQVDRLPPNAIDRATAVDDARAAVINDAAIADRDRAAREARDAAARVGPLPQSTMTDRAPGSSASTTTSAPVVPPPTIPN